MSCNPSIGGIGKGHLVREVDALDGLMGRAADARRHPFQAAEPQQGSGGARAARAGRPRRCTARPCSGCWRTTPGLTIRAGAVEDLEIGGDGRLAGVLCADGTADRRGRGGADHRHLPARRDPHRRPADRGRTGRGGAVDRPGPHTGAAWPAAGPAEDRHAAAAGSAAPSTGTAWTADPGDAVPSRSATLTERITNPQVACRITATTPATHAIIRANLHRSAVYGGRIEGAGPRYCPSIEDKVVRFADRERHQIFLEPEGLDDDTVYPNGISTSLPAEVQAALLRDHPGAGAGPHDPAGLRRRIRLRRSARARPRRWKCGGCRACSSPGRSTAPPATRRRRRRG